MEYIIKNSKEVYIRLGKNGQPVTCEKNDKGIFEYSKARNICAGLPKTFKKFHFRVEPLQEFKSKDKQIIENPYYKVPETIISNWLEKCKMCENVINEAKLRREELRQERLIIDKKITDILHKIELLPSQNMYQGYLLYKNLRNTQIKRREVKDELFVIEGILNMDFRNFAIDKVRKTINGLENRKYEIRIVEGEDEVNGNM